MWLVCSVAILASIPLMRPLRRREAAASRRHGASATTSRSRSPVAGATGS
jgi:hypothetical protein